MKYISSRNGKFLSILFLFVASLIFTHTTYAVNSAPVLDSSRSPALSSVTEDPGAPTGAVGTLVSSLVDFTIPTGQVDNVTDVDGGSIGIAVTAVDTNLTCYYSVNGGVTWSAIGAASDSSARLLAADSDNRIYCQPALNITSAFSTALTFRAWDQTSGIDGATTDTSTSGGTSAFSTATDTVSLFVVAVNDGPQATNLSAAETYTQNVSHNLTDIVVTDVDSGTVTATLTLSAPVAGALSTATSGAVTSTYNSGTGVWSAAGAVADINTLLAGVTYIPAFSYGSSFTIATNVSDGVAAALTGTKTVTCSTNTAPVAFDDEYSLLSNSAPTGLFVLNNDTDIDTDTLSIVFVSSPDNGGSAEISGDVIIYSPAVDFFGIETFAYTATDPSGATSSATVTMNVVDITPPETFFVSSSADTIGASVATFVFNSDEVATTFECSVDNGAFTLCTSPYNTENLSAGEHTFEVRARDASDNLDATPAVASWIISGVGVSNVYPTSGAINMSTTTPVVFHFTEPVPEYIAAHTTIAASPCDGSCPTLNGVWSENNTVLTYLKTDGPFIEGVTYVIQLTASNGIQTDLLYGGSFTIANVVSVVSGGGMVPVEFLKSMTPSNDGTMVPSTAMSFNFTKILKKGMDDLDVTQLQKYLRSKGFEVTPVGQETTVFGSKTKKQLALFQKSVGIVPASGIFGSITMGYVNSHK